jgi:hypothetical protein
MRKEYIYILNDCKFIKRMLNIFDTYKYIPLIINDIEKDINNLKDAKLLLAYKKPYSGIFGLLIIENILSRKDDIDIFKKIVIEYMLADIPDLYFLKVKDFINLERLYYNKKILIKDLNRNINKYNFSEIKLLKLEIFEVEHIFVTKILQIIDQEYVNFINDKDYYDKCFIKYLDENNILESTDNLSNSSYISAGSKLIKTEEESDIEDSESTNSSETEEYEDNNFKLDKEEISNIVQMKIPILWIPCTILKTKIKKESITKSVLNNHYRNCDLCEVINNNRNEIDLEKILFSYKDDENSDELNEIIKYYKFTKNYIILKKNVKKYKIDLEKLNLFYYDNKNEEIYNECIFILQSKKCLL